MKIGYHVSHEQFSPGLLLDLVKKAESAGFTAALSSDHFAPWSEHQGHSGFAWSWLGAALASTKLPFGVVNAPGQRYHPAVIAQAAATLAEMFPGRFFIAVGSGQFVNESITGTKWSPKPQRNERLRECGEVIRRLWRGETVYHYGHVTIEDARLYSLPEKKPLMIGAAITPDTARWLGSWADGLITTSRPPEKLRKVVDAFRAGGGEGKPMYLKVQLSYSRTYDAALIGAWEQWKTVVFNSRVLTELRVPGEFDAAGQFVSEEEMPGHVLISEKPEQHIAWLREFAEMGFEHLYLHNVNTEQEQFIRDFGERVIPALLAPEVIHV
jgi:coenzyme F420-dependent glucose-6-phosphate dehydrogenase